MAATRSRVLSCFRVLHRARETVFADDEFALEAGRIKINEEFKKCKGEEDPAKIEELIDYGLGARKFLLEEVVQAKVDEETGNYKLQMRDDLPLVDNKMYDENTPAPPRGKRKK